MKAKATAAEVVATRGAKRLTIFESLLVSVAVSVALLLRIYGLDWGLPSPAQVHSYHPDEITVIGPTLHMNIFTGEMNPHFFNYGSLFLYAVYFARLFAEGNHGICETAPPRPLAFGPLRYRDGSPRFHLGAQIGRKVGRFRCLNFACHFPNACSTQSLRNC